MACSPNSSAPPMTISMALLPMIDIQAIMKASGSNSVPMTNSRMVRPREMRARNSPTKGPQAIHQAQKNTVQAFSQSVGRW